MDKKLSLPQLLLLGLCLGHLLCNTLWLTLNQFPLSWDPAGHTRLAIQYSEYFQGTLRHSIPFLSISSYYPPLTHLITAGLVLLLGSSVFVTAFPITLYFLGSLLGIFLLSKRISKNEWVAVCTAAIFSFYPPIYDSSRQFLLELPLIFWLVWSLYFLSRKNFLEKSQSVLPFAFTVSALALTKWVGVIFVVIPFAGVLYYYWKKGWQEKYSVMLIALAGIFFLLTLPWYLNNIDRLIEIGKLASQGEITDPQSIWSLDNWLFYFKSFLNFQLSLWPALIALLSLIGYAVIKQAPYKSLLFFYLGTGYIIFSLISNKDLRYTLPLLLVIAFTSAYTLVYWFSKKTVLFILPLGGMVFLIAQFFILSFHLLPSYQRAWNLGPLGWIDYVNTGDIIVQYPRPDTTPNKQILSYFTLKHRSDSVSIMVGVDQPDINPSTLDFFITLNDYWQISLEAPYNVLDGFSSENQIQMYLSRFDYLLIPTGEVGPDAVRHKKALEQIRDYVISKRGSLYQEIKYFPLENHPGEILVFQHAE